MGLSPSVFLLAVMIMLPCCACASSSFLAGFLTTRVHCTDTGYLSPHSLKPPFIISNKKACFSALNPPAPSTIIQKLPFILSLLWQEASGFSDFLFSHSGSEFGFFWMAEKNPARAEKHLSALNSGCSNG